MEKAQPDTNHIIVGGRKIGKLSAERQIKDLRLVDENWYFETYPEAVGYAGGAFQHYLDRGAQQGFDPNPFFHTLWYRQTRPDLAASGMNPLVHYVFVGSPEGARPSPHFDPAWYRKAYPDVGSAALEPLAHYLQSGQYEGRWPADRDAVQVQLEALIDEAWYRANHPESAAYPGGVVRHYLDRGALRGYDPNPFFATAWYRSLCPDLEQSGMNPLLHYVLVGSPEGVRPSPHFDPGWYRETYADIAAAGIEPLGHYLRWGRFEGRLTQDPGFVRHVTEAPLRVVKPPPEARERAFFVTHAPQGKIKPHIFPCLRALRAAGLSTTVIVATELVEDIATEALAQLVDGLLVRANEGFDFAAWAHAVRLSDLSGAELVCLVNDSVVGPLGQEAFDAVMTRVRGSGADLLCLTENAEIQRHFQSYFLVARRRGVEALEDFLAQVTSRSTKTEVIHAYEIKLLDSFRERGLSSEALFQTSGSANATIVDWRRLVEEGFPFVKTAALTSESAAEWRAVLAERGCDPDVVQASLDIIEASRRPQPAAPPPRAVMRDMADDIALAVPCGLASAAAEPPGRIAVICHLFYPELAVEVRSLLRNIPYPCDLFIATDTPQKRDRIQTVFAGWPGGSVEVRLAPNRGRDVAPKFVAFRDIYARYDFTLQIHSKQSLHSRALRNWRDYLYSTLAGTPEIVRSIMGAFATAPRLGIVGCQHYEPMRRWANWGGDFPAVQTMARRWGLELDPSAALDFPSGTMFWARTAALRPLLDLELSLADFEPEAGQIDGTLAHAVERALYLCAEAADFAWCKIGRPEYFSADGRFERVDDAPGLTRFLAERAWRISDRSVRPGEGGFPAIESTPAAVLADSQRRALGLDGPAPGLRIAVGVVSFNNPAEQLNRCLRSAAGAEFRLLWDNGRSSELPADLQRLVRQGGGEGNLGFGAAHNRLMAIAFGQGADVYVCANPDGLFHPAALGRIARMMAVRDGAAVIECSQFPVEHPKRFDEASLRTPWVSGAAMAISRRVYETIGGFDERFFMYCEDVDLSWRARAHGFETAVCPTALFVHEVTNRASSEATLRMIAESGARLGHKWGSRAFARWSLTQGPGARAPVDPGEPAPREWRDVADFDHGFSFAETRWS